MFKVMIEHWPDVSFTLQSGTELLSTVSPLAVNEIISSPVLVEEEV